MAVVVLLFDEDVETEESVRCFRVSDRDEGRTCGFDGALAIRVVIQRGQAGLSAFMGYGAG